MTAWELKTGDMSKQVLIQNQAGEHEIQEKISSYRYYMHDQPMRHGGLGEICIYESHTRSTELSLGLEMQESVRDIV